MLYLNEKKQPFHMRYNSFLHYAWFLQILGKDFICTRLYVITIIWFDAFLFTQLWIEVAITQSKVSIYFN